MARRVTRKIGKRRFKCSVTKKGKIIKGTCTRPGRRKKRRR